MSDFIYCLNSSTIKPAPLMDKIRIAAEVGYQAIELWHDDIDLHLLQGGTLEEIRRELDNAGLAVPTTIFLKGWFDTTGEAHENALTECKRRMDQAAAVGAKHCIGGPPHDPHLDYELGAANYAELLETGVSQFGVRPVMEYLGFAQDLKTIEAALRIIELCGHPDATTVVDPFHCYVGGGPIESISKLKPTQIAISHFNDAPAEPEPATQRDPDRVMPGDGAIDLKLYCDQLRGIGYDQCLSLELFSEHYWAQDPAEVAGIGLAKMRTAAEA